MTYPEKPATAAAPIIDVIARRWSPRAFSRQHIEPATIASLFEAARWAPSSFNEQPWRFVYAGKDEPDRKQLESLLTAGNSWALEAGLLILSFTKPLFTKNGKENRHAFHDLGAASFALCLQATSMGLISHQMEGFAVERANAALGVPSEFIPGSMIAIGMPGDPAALPPELRKREEAPRTRNDVSSFAFRGTWTH